MWQKFARCGRDLDHTKISKVLGITLRNWDIDFTRQEIQILPGTVIGNLLQLLDLDRSF